ncbi:MAG: hypothetical protein A2677_00600 [Candidatus Komeilibacteria bacterium RIFCSPHIGHO2_01_FULL_52_14]|uniref:Carbonic anhydrase n=1 Tax=Candidatus Komeilibacteria bacterium RIFCSPHIGHO2_01_FULL_52_14 TaxID=1798549 RepID=A0A1G2BJH5_9BACT|nr:MAG: hypothetical protein A2677_00600 [Candidatus Komeilibacteria bacterium RIFCSPHIGHO2_01_FULL_52_14]
MHKNYSIPLASLPFEKHRCRSAAISCIDFRFLDADRQFIHSLTEGNFDHIKIAGAGKILLAGSPLRGEITNTIRNVCVKLHGITELIVLNHWDCGAYGSSKSFSSPQEEEERHIRDLTEVRSFLHSEFPSLAIIVGYSTVTGGQLEYRLVEHNGAPGNR